MNKFLTMSKRIGAVLIDLSGTIHVDDAVIPGSIEALKKLRATNVKIKFVTNTTKESKRKLHERLSRIGFDIHKDEIFTSLTAARQLIDKRNLRPYMLIADAAKEEFCDLPSENLNAVLVGLAPEKFNYEHLTTAFRYILEGAQLIAIHKARYYKRSDGLALGPGAFVAGLEYSTVKIQLVRTSTHNRKYRRMQGRGRGKARGNIFQECSRGLRLRAGGSCDDWR
ncbi:haloacid dehalogenase-like hydrolase domain-containing protein 2 isoform X3 [Penaeus vannamei]|uniref:haloacid dehalogenase-like hydrolase domain-containing protein 2 isoform X3 n=1 Tax=Penaeus vannamei TaxID=6689 RepID=UPI00387FAF11